jgi:hypothetical protein
MTPAGFRKLALQLPETEEKEHMHHPDFRVRGKIFATLGYPSNSFGMVNVWPDQQKQLVKKYPSVFTVIPGKWGEQGATRVHLGSASVDAVASALQHAWDKHAAKVAAKAGNKQPRARAANSSSSVQKRKRIK